MQKLWALIDGLVASLKGQLSGERLDALNAKLASLADKGIPVAIGVLVLSGVAMSVKLDDSDWVSKGIGGAIAVVILGYLSHRFSEGCRTAGDGERSTLSLSVYLDVIIVALALACLGACLGGLKMMFDGDFSQAAAAWSGGFICLIVAWTFSNPDRLGVHIDTRAGASNDLLSLYSITLRAVLRIALPVSSFVVIIATASTLLSLLLALLSDGMEGLQYSAGVGAGTGTILAGVAAPVVVYLMYVVLSFMVAFAENVLSIKDVARNTRSEGPAATASVGESATDPGE
jgi:hypothetical protein